MSLPESAWGTYGEEQNSAIEQAYLAGETHGSICVGIRNFEVVFSPNPDFAMQKDPRLRKCRLVRRRVVSRSEQNQVLTPLLTAMSHGETTCALCAEEFAETAMMPT